VQTFIYNATVTGNCLENLENFVRNRTDKHIQLSSDWSSPR
jgi:hypothetical protein